MYVYMYIYIYIYIRMTFYRRCARATHEPGLAAVESRRGAALRAGGAP